MYVTPIRLPGSIFRFALQEAPPPDAGPAAPMVTERVSLRND